MEGKAFAYDTQTNGLGHPPDPPDPPDEPDPVSSTAAWDPLPHAPTARDPPATRAGVRMAGCNSCKISIHNLEIPHWM